MTKKFRIWDNNQNKYRDSSGELRLSRTLETFCLGLHFQRESLDDRPWVSNLEIEQFTGLLDSTGKEIYEGDIIRGEFYDTDYRCSSVVTHPVVFNNGAFNVSSRLWHKPTLKIIGNIHENNT